jgi:aspartyl-tRNA synthetase
MLRMYRDHNCGELTIKNVGEKVTIAGWVQRIRNLGSMIFIDLRDQFGITQIVVSADNKEKLENAIKDAVNESIKKVQMVMAKKMQTMEGLNIPGLK